MFAAMYWNQMRWFEPATELLSTRSPPIRPICVARPACDELRVERAVERVVLGQRDVRRTFGSFCDRHPADIREAAGLDEVLEHRRELRHRTRRAADLATFAVW